MSAYKKTLLAALLCGATCTALALPKGGDYYKGGATGDSVGVNGDPYRQTADKAALSFKNSSYVEVENIIRPIRNATGGNPVNGSNPNADVDGRRNVRHVTLHDVVPAVGHIINPRLGQVWYENRAHGTEVYSLRQTTFLSPEFGGLVVAKVPGLKDGNNVYFGEWAPREALPARNSTDLNMDSRQRSAWFAGDKPTGNMPQLVNAKYNVLGISKHTPGRNDFYTGSVTARFGTAPTGTMEGSISRGDDHIDFNKARITNKDGTFADQTQGMTGRFYGSGAAAMAGYTTRGTAGVGDDVAFGGRGHPTSK